MAIRSLAHVCLKTLDLDKTTEFYCGVLGLKKMFNFTRKGKIIGFYMKAENETFVEAFVEPEIEKLGKQVLNHFCLETDDVDALHQRVIAAGYTPDPIRLGADGNRQFWMTDPNGLRIEFQQYSEGCSQRAGGDVEATW